MTFKINFQIISPDPDYILPDEDHEHIYNEMWKRGNGIRQNIRQRAIEVLQRNIKNVRKDF